MATKKSPDNTTSALNAAKQFLTHTIDHPDELKAKALLTAQSLAVGTFTIPAEMAGAKYTIGEPVTEDGQLFIPVEISAAGQTLTVPLAPVQEDGQWKLDMNRTMEKLMGGMMESAVGQMAQAMGQVMEGVGQAIAAGFENLAAPSETNNNAGPPQIDPADLDDFKTKVLRPLEKQVQDQTDAVLPLDVDFPSLLTASDATENRRLLATLKDRVLSNWAYYVNEANQKIPLQNRVKAIRIEGVKDARDRAVFAEGARIIYRLNLAEDAGFYTGSNGDDIGKILIGVAAGMAETAPPTDVLSRGPSYRPTGDAPQIMANYAQFVLPVLTSRIAQLLGQELKIDADWRQFADDSDDAAGLWIWGLNRICGAIGLLTANNNDNRDLIAQGLKLVRIFALTEPAMKSVKIENDELWIYIAPSTGERGCFYEQEIADAISTGLKLRLRPMIAELERYAKTWEQSLLETFGRPIKFAFDFDTFAGHPDENKSIFALTLLREHGIDRLYYALTAVADKNPNFKQQIPKRIAWLYLECVPTPEAKMVDGEQTTIRYRLFLFEGYKGYLTQKELEAQLPKIVANMPDIDWETPAEPAAQEAVEEELPDEEATEPSSEDQDSEPESESTEDPRARAFADMQSQVEALLPTLSHQLKQFIGEPLPLEIAWDTVDDDLAAVGELLNAAITPVLGGLGQLGQNSALRNAIGASIDKIVLERAAAPESQGFSLRNRILTFAAHPSRPTMTPQSAATILRALLNPNAAKPKSKSKPKQKPPVVQKKKTSPPAKKIARKMPAKRKPAPKKRTAKKVIAKKTSTKKKKRK